MFPIASLFTLTFTLMFPISSMIFETISRLGLLRVIIGNVSVRIFEVRFASPMYAAVTVYNPLALTVYPLKDADPLLISTFWL